MDTFTVWAAGFFDGEGCIQLKRTAKSRTRTLYVIIANYDEGAIMKLQERWGGSVNRRGRAFYWNLTARKALIFLREIQPFLVTQKNIARVKVAIEFQEQKPAPGRKISNCRLVAEEMLFARLAQARAL